MAGIAGEVKAEILTKVKAGQKVSELSKQYGVSDKTIYNWLYIHSDQGVEYTKLVQDFGVQISMSTKASPWKNGYQECFYNNFKTDLGLEFDRFQDEGHFLEAIHHILYDYNHTRIHSILKMPPAKFYANYLEAVSTKMSA